MVNLWVPGADGTSSRRKFDRGVEQVRELLAEIDEFEADPDAVQIKTETKRLSGNSLEVRCVGQLTRPVPAHWSLLAGDAIQNLRASLEHMVFSAADGLNPNTGFPIARDLASFDREAKRRLEGVPSEIQEIIRDVQPFADSDVAVHAGDARYLETLRDLSNADKHKVLATVLFAVSTEWVGLPENVLTSWLKLGTHQEVNREQTEISTFVLTYEDDLHEPAFEPGFKFRIEIERKDPRMLEGIARAVHRVLHECEHGEPLSPLAQYPI